MLCLKVIFAFREITTSVTNQPTNKQDRSQYFLAEVTSEAQIPLCRLSRDVRDKSATNLFRPLWCVRDVADFPVSCRGRRQFPRFATTQTGLLPTCHGNFSSYHLDMSRWFETPKHPRDFPVTWSMSATSPRQVADFLETARDTGKIRGSRRNGMWAFENNLIANTAEI